MSRTFQTVVPCPGCQTELELTGYDSVNADRDPALRTAILEGELQSHTCACGAELRGAPEFSYLDTARKQWIAVHPYGGIGDWQASEEATQALFDQALGKDAPPTAQEIGAGIHPRLVFGWGGLREKLVAHDHGLDDVHLECLKLQVMKTQGLMPAPGQELRLIEVEDGKLRIALIEAENENAVNGFEVPQAAYDEVVEAPEGWTQIREPLLSGCFVDAQKLFLG